MAIVYTDTLDSITAEHLGGGFFDGWSKQITPEQHLKIMQNCTAVVLAIDEASGQVVGYITALSDDILSVFIPNIEVLPPYKGQGIGSELMRRMLERYAHVPNVDLMCDPDVQPFYQHFGMIPYTGMLMRKDVLLRTED